MDPRHQQRVQTVQNLFAYSFPQLCNNLPSAEDTMTQTVISHLPQIDTFITKNAKKFSIDKIAKIDLSILRLAVCELVVIKKEPPKVIINEAVELAKAFGGDKSYGFVNAILGKVVSK